MIKVAQRKAGLYKIVSANGFDVSAKRCVKAAGHSLSNAKSVFIIREENKPEIVAQGKLTDIMPVSEPKVLDIGVVPSENKEEKKVVVRDVIELRGMGISSGIVDAFEDLMYRLSPENLACDGECG